MLFVPFMFFMAVGNFRLFLKWVILKPWQVILWKSTLMINGIIYFMIGAYYMMTNYQLTRGFMPAIESKLKDFVLLFVFANFSLFMEMYSGVSGKDKTEDLEYKYVFEEDDEDEIKSKRKKSKSFSSKIVEEGS
jgi:hypothetical protein